MLFMLTYRSCGNCFLNQEKAFQKLPHDRYNYIFHLTQRKFNISFQFAKENQFRLKDIEDSAGYHISPTHKCEISPKNNFLGSVESSYQFSSKSVFFEFRPLRMFKYAGSIRSAGYYPILVQPRVVLYLTKLEEISSLSDSCTLLAIASRFSVFC